MFTGIVEAVGRIAAMERTGGDLRLTVAFRTPNPVASDTTANPVAVNASPDPVVVDTSPNTVGAAVGRDRGAADHAGPGSSPGKPARDDRRTDAHPDSAVAANGRSYSSPWDDRLRLGESIAVSGVCLTVVAFDALGFSADVSTETLACTTLGGKRIGDPVNLERALLPTTRLGGHLVAGHVDGVGQVAAIADDGRAQRWRFTAPEALLRFIAGKGSIAVDGVSLTVNTVHADGFEVALIPHTVAQTAFATTAVRDAVNLEVDLIARYIARLHA